MTGGAASGPPRCTALGVDYADVVQVQVQVLEDEGVERFDASWK
ncbi:hypothetical protein [Streptomyces sp. CB02959]|nr:hypothetical protein [Streptomyces sp. CB02959]